MYTFWQISVYIYLRSTGLISRLKTRDPNSTRPRTISPSIERTIGLQKWIKLTVQSWEGQRSQPLLTDWKHTSVTFCDKLKTSVFEVRWVFRLHLCGSCCWTWSQLVKYYKRRSKDLICSKGCSFLQHLPQPIRIWKRIVYRAGQEAHGSS